MNPEEFKIKIQEIRDIFKHDIEVSHSQADNLLCNVLIELGYIEGVEIFQDMVKWYS